MHPEIFRLPNGNTTTDKVEYAKTWSALGSVVERLFRDCTTIGFDPGVLVSIGGKSVDLPIAVVLRLVELEKERGPDDLATRMDKANADCVRSTPLVTEEKP